MKFKRFAAVLGILCLLLGALCLPGPGAPAWAMVQAQGPDYSQAANWLCLAQTTDHPVDVFWVYPTVYNGQDLVAKIDDPEMKKGALYTIRSQAGVFAGQANLYAPLYRQVKVTVLAMDQKQQDRYLGIGLGDVQAAFDYYLAHYNQGRPIILAGHSQGSNLLAEFARANFQRPELQKKLVAAYLIGWSVTQDDLQKYPALRMCRSAGQTGCIVAYNSVAAGYQKKAPTILPGAVSVNPLSWRTDGELVPAVDNLGAVFISQDGGEQQKPHYTSAQNLDGGLVVNPPDPQDLDHMPFGPGVYHAYDYSFFYENLKANVAQRIRAFQEAQARAAK